MTTDFSDIDTTVATQPAPPRPPWSPRTSPTVRWVGWHLGELTAVGVTVAVAVVTGNPWGLLLTGAVVVGWVANERRLARKKAHARHGVLTTVGGAGTDTASPTPASVRGVGAPGDVEDTREPA